ncbi:MAG: helix-turn-helix transcriptional regulator [Candidatus Magasanikbacteria bacterium]|nr:helix-turn-helix transcriptional regulator [Candidatus Magasanikbacteria bacterium]
MKKSTGRRGPMQESRVGSSSTKLGAYVRERRLELGLTQAEVAGEKMNSNHVANIESGANQKPRDATLLYVAERLPCSLDSLRSLRDGVSLKAMQDAKKNPSFGKYIQQRRIELGFSAVELARKLSCSAAALASAEREVSRLKSISAQKLAETLQCTVKKIEKLRPEPLTRAPSKIRVTRESPFGKRIYEARVKHGLSAKAVAAKLGITFQFLLQVETGEAYLKKASRLITLSELLQIPYHELVTLQGPKPPRKVTLVKNLEAIKNPLLRFLVEERIKRGFTRVGVQKLMGLKFPLFNFENEKMMLTSERALKYAEVIGVEIPEDLLAYVCTEVSSEIMVTSLISVEAIRAMVAQGWSLQLIKGNETLLVTIAS